MLSVTLQEVWVKKSSSTPLIPVVHKYDKKEPSSVFQGNAPLQIKNKSSEFTIYYPDFFRIINILDYRFGNSTAIVNLSTNGVTWVASRLQYFHQILLFLCKSAVYLISGLNSHFSNKNMDVDLFPLF